MAKVHETSTVTGIRTDRRANLVGALWMVGAMAAFALEDALVTSRWLDLPRSAALRTFEHYLRSYLPHLRTIVELPARGK